MKGVDKMSVISLNKNNFEQEVNVKGKPVLVDFWAPWCMPCRAMSPILEELAREHPEVKVAKVNVDEEQELALKYKIMGIPALVVFKEGEPAARNVGLTDKRKLEEMLK